MPIQHTKQIIRKIFGTKSKEECTDGSAQGAGCSLEGHIEQIDESSIQIAQTHGAGESQPPGSAAPTSSSHALARSPKALTGANSSLKPAPSGKTAVFFARVLPTATQDELLELFSKFGAVQDLHLFRPFAEAKASKGCGIVRYTTSAAAASAKATLHNKHRWTAESSAMVVEWVNEEKMRSACVKAGSSEVVFEPKSRTGKHKHAHQAAAGSSSSSTLVSPSDLAAAAAGRSSGSGDLSQFHGVPNYMLHNRQLGLGSHSGVGYNTSLSGGFAMPMQPPPPPMPRATSLTWQQQQQQQWQQQSVGWSAHSAGGTLSHVSSDGSVLLSPNAAALALAQQQQRQRLMSSRYPGSSGGGPAAAAAAAAPIDQSDIVQAVLAASTATVGGAHSGRDAFIPTYGGFDNDSNVANALLQQQLLQQQQLASLTAAQLAMNDNAGALSAGALAAAAAAAAAGMSGSAVGTRPQPFLQQQQQQEHELYNLLEGSSSANAHVINRQYSNAAAAAAAAGGAWARIQSADLAATAGLDLGMSGDFLPRQITSAGRNIQDPVLSGSNAAAAAAILQQQLSGTLSGPELHARPGVLDTQVEDQYEEQWAAAYGAGYFDMPAGAANSSFTENPNAAGLFTSNLAGSSSSNLVPSFSGGSEAMINAAATAAQQVAASAQSDSMLPRWQQLQQLSSESNAMCASSDPSLMGVGNAGFRGVTAHSFTAGQQQQLLQQQILRQQQQQGTSLGLTLPASMGVALPPNAPAAAAVSLNARIMPPQPAPPPAAASSSSSALAASLQLKLNLLDNPSSSAHTPDLDPHLCGSSSSMKLSAVVAAGAAVIPALAPHIQSITNMTGAAVHIAPVESGEIALYVTGTADQINTAKGIVDLLLHSGLDRSLLTGRADQIVSMWSKVS